MYFDNSEFQNLSPAENQKTEGKEFLLDPNQFASALDQMVAEREARQNLASRPKTAVKKRLVNPSLEEFGQSLEAIASGEIEVVNE